MKNYIAYLFIVILLSVTQQAIGFERPPIGTLWQEFNINMRKNIPEKCILINFTQFQVHLSLTEIISLSELTNNKDKASGQKRYYSRKAKKLLEQINKIEDKSNCHELIGDNAKEHKRLVAYLIEEGMATVTKGNSENIIPMVTVIYHGDDLGGHRSFYIYSKGGVYDKKSFLMRVKWWIS